MKEEDNGTLPGTWNLHPAQRKFFESIAKPTFQHPPRPLAPTPWLFLHEPEEDNEG